VIESFEARHAESRAEAAQYKEQLGAAQQQLDVSQLRVRELVEDKGRLRQQAEQAAAAGADAEHALQAQLAELRAEAAQCGPLRQQVQLLEQQLEDARGDLGGAHRQLQTLSDTVDAANDAIVVSGNGGSCTSSASSSMVVYGCLLCLPGLHLTCLPV
jgi:chromosome segregation ATPase